ncbi:hypothetical protein R3P38DRAFT_2844562, partial [Favolaschia claudopus]
MHKLRIRSNYWERPACCLLIARRRRTSSPPRIILEERIARRLPHDSCNSHRRQKQHHVFDVRRLEQHPFRTGDIPNACIHLFKCIDAKRASLHARGFFPCSLQQPACFFQSKSLYYWQTSASRCSALRTLNELERFSALSFLGLWVRRVAGTMEKRNVLFQTLGLRSASGFCYYQDKSRLFNLSESTSDFNSSLESRRRILPTSNINSVLQVQLLTLRSQRPSTPLQGKTTSHSHSLTLLTQEARPGTWLNTGLRHEANERKNASAALMS